MNISSEEGRNKQLNKSFNEHLFQRQYQVQKLSLNGFSGKKKNDLSVEEALTKKYNEVFDREQLQDRLKKCKEENHQLESENQKLKSKNLQLEVKSYYLLSGQRDNQKLINDKLGNTLSRLVFDAQNIFQQLEEKDEKILELKRKDKINRCQELEIQIESYIEETQRLKKIIIEQAKDYKKVKNQIHQYQDVHKINQQVKITNRNLMIKVENLQQKWMIEKDKNKQSEEQLEKLEKEIENFKRILFSMKQTNQSLSYQQEKVSKKEISPDVKAVYERDKQIMSRIIEKQKMEIKKLKYIIFEKQQAMKQTADKQNLQNVQPINHYPYDIQLILYSIKQQMNKNQVQMRSLAQIFDNDKEPYDDKISKWQIKNKLKKWPFQLSNQTHLVRLVEWLSKEHEYLHRKEFINKFSQLLIPYPIFQFNQDDIDQLNQYLNQARDKIEQKFVNEYLNIVQLMDIIYSSMPEQYANIYQYVILQRVQDLDKIPQKQCLEEIKNKRMRAKSTIEQKSIEKVSPLRSIKYTPDYHIKKLSQTAQVSPVNFMDFYL